MSWWSEFADRVVCDAPLGPLTWFRVGGRACYLCRPADAKELASLVTRARSQGLSVRVLGAGANVLVRDDGVDGVVVLLDQPAFRTVRWSKSTVTVGAGVDLMPFSRQCSTDGWSGLACMAGIPATVGGAVCMNAGGRFGDFSRVVREVEVLTAKGALEQWPRDRLGFGYRRSALCDEIVVAARLELEEDDPIRTSARYDECFAYKRSSQPLAEKSAGCIFKNPAGEFSAGALIDRAGLKGMRRGGARVSRQHANFIVADRGTTASDILHLIDAVRDRVRYACGEELEVEVDIWGPGCRSGAQTEGESVRCR